MFFERELVLVCLFHNAHFKPKDNTGLHNRLPDSQSPLQLQTFNLRNH